MIKKFWKSRTFWVNLLAGIGLVLQGALGYEAFPLEAQATVLAVANLILRMVTREPVTW